MPRSRDPLALSTAHDDGVEAPPSETRALQTALVLVVDGDPELLRMIARVLEPRYRVATALDGDDGFLQALVLRPDVIVSDIQVPGLTVSDLLRAVRDQPELTDIPFLLLMDGVAEAVQLQSSSRGGENYLSKPFSVSQLRERVATHVTLRRRPALSREVG
jgi:CheY-like chemotaxis protein